MRSRRRKERASEPPRSAARARPIANVQNATNNGKLATFPCSLPPTMSGVSEQLAFHGTRAFARSRGSVDPGLHLAGSGPTAWHDMSGSGSDPSPDQSARPGRRAAGATPPLPRTPTSVAMTTDRAENSQVWRRESAEREPSYLARSATSDPGAEGLSRGSRADRRIERALRLRTG